MADYLINGAVTNALNMPSITAEEAPRLKPFVKLAEVLGAFAGQVTEDPIKEVEILYDGRPRAMNTKRADQRRPCRPDPAAGLRRQHGLGADHGEGARHHRRRGQARQVGRLRRLHQADGDDRAAGRARSPAPASPTASRASSRSRASTSTPRSASTCSTSPTTTSRASSACSARCCGKNGVNIANFNLGRDRPGGDAIALLYLDAPFPEEVLAKVRAHASIDSAKRLQFDVNGF